MEKSIKSLSKCAKKCVIAFSNVLEFDIRGSRNVQINIVQECEEIFLWNLHKDMSLVANVDFVKEQ